MIRLGINDLYEIYFKVHFLAQKGGMHFFENIIKSEQNFY